MKYDIVNGLVNVFKKMFMKLRKDGRDGKEKSYYIHRKRNT